MLGRLRSAHYAEPDAHVVHAANLLVVDRAGVAFALIALTGDRPGRWRKDRREVWASAGAARNSIFSITPAIS